MLEIPERVLPVPNEKTSSYAESKKPRFIWNKRDKRKAAEPLPAQVVEIIRPFYAKTQTVLDRYLRQRRPESNPYHAVKGREVACRSKRNWLCSMISQVSKYC